MEEIKAPKKERKFLKGLGEIALVLIRELVLGIGKKVINKVGNKRERLVIAIIILASSFAFAQYPATSNKQRLGYQTTGDGLVFRGRSSDTTALKPSTINNAFHLFDTVNNVLFSYIKTKGGWKFNNSDTVIINGVTMPFDSITFNTVKDGTVGVGEVEYNDTQGSLIQGLKGGLVTNVIGQQLHQRVNNRTGSTLAKGTAVYLSGSQGNRITVAKALGITDAFSANTFGIVSESILNNQSGYIITEGLITNINTSALVEDSAVYLSPTVAGALTSTKPQAPQHTVYIGVCVKSNAGSGELFVKIFNGQQLEELHNVRITSPVNNASLYYKLNEKLWRDTTAALLVSDTASMLTNYLRTGVAASTYLTQSLAALTYLPLAGGIMTGTINRQEDNNNGSALTFYYNILNYFARKDNAKGNQTAQISFTDRPGTDNFPNEVRTSDIHLMTAHNWNGSAYGQYLDTTLSVVANQDGGRIGINKLNPAYKLDVNGTLGVTGATTLSNLAGSGTRMVTASSTGLLSSQTIPSGTLVGADTVSLSNRINTKVGLSGNETINGVKTFSAPITTGGLNLTSTTSGTNRLLGLNSVGGAVGQITVGSGLNLSASDVLTATGGSGTVTSVSAGSPANGLNVATGTTTPVISMALAASGTIGVVSATTQVFSGSKTFEGLVAFQRAIQRPTVNVLVSSASVTTQDTWVVVNNAGTVTLTLPTASSSTGTEFHIKTITNNSVISASSNVVPLTGGGASQAILSATSGKWATLVSDGTNWVIMQAN